MESINAHLDWNLSGKELKRLIYEAGFNSPNAFARYFDLPDNTVWSWIRKESVPRGRLVAIALRGLYWRARYERLEKSLELQSKN